MVLPSAWTANTIERVSQLEFIRQLIGPVEWTLSLGIFAWRRHLRLRRLPQESESVDVNNDGLAAMGNQVALCQQRILELEERLDFAERMLAERRDAAREPPRKSVRPLPTHPTPAT
jgi:hypothetical protein